MSLSIHFIIPGTYNLIFFLRYLDIFLASMIFFSFISLNHVVYKLTVFYLLWEDNIPTCTYVETLRYNDLLTEELIVSMPEELGTKAGETSLKILCGSNTGQIG